jgi:hypothetical protein
MRTRSKATASLGSGQGGWTICTLVSDRITVGSLSHGGAAHVTMRPAASASATVGASTGTDAPSPGVPEVTPVRRPVWSMTATRTVDSSCVSSVRYRAGALETSGIVGAGVTDGVDVGAVVVLGGAGSGLAVAGVPLPLQAATIRTTAMVARAIDRGRRMDGGMVVGSLLVRG